MLYYALKTSHLYYLPCCSCRSARTLSHLFRGHSAFMTIRLRSVALQGYQKLVFERSQFRGTIYCPKTTKIAQNAKYELLDVYKTILTIPFHLLDYKKVFHSALVKGDVYSFGLSVFEAVQSYFFYPQGSIVLFVRHFRVLLSNSSFQKD